MIGWIVFVFVLVDVILALACWSARADLAQAKEQIEILDERCYLLGERVTTLIDEKRRLMDDVARTRLQRELYKHGWEKWQKLLERSRAHHKAKRRAKAVKS